MTPELCGSFTFWHANDRIHRTWYVWATLDEDGQLDHIYLGLGKLLTMATGPLNAPDCTTPLYRRAWRYAQAEARSVQWSAGADDGVVIDLFDD